MTANSGETYEHDSIEKRQVRDKWVEFADKIDNLNKEEFSMLTLTTDSLDDFKLFLEKGFFKAEQKESGKYDIKKGKILCIESNGATSRKLVKLLPNNTVFSGELGQVITEDHGRVFSQLMPSKFFPCDVINLDFTGNITTVSKRGIDTILKSIVELEKKYEKSFSLFLTFANTEKNNEEFMQKFHTILEENISNENTDFKKEFESKHESLERIKEENVQSFIVISLIKHLIKYTALSKYLLTDFEYYSYEKNKEKIKYNMVSLLFNFKKVNESTSFIDIYKEDCLKSLGEIKNLSENK